MNPKSLFEYQEDFCEYQEAVVQSQEAFSNAKKPFVEYQPKHSEYQETFLGISSSIFWMVIPSLSLFITLPLLLKLGINFYIGMILSILVTICCYGLMLIILPRLGIDI